MPAEPSASTAHELVDVVRAFAESDLRELSVSSGDIELFISRDVAGTPPAATRQSPQAPTPVAHPSVDAVDVPVEATPTAEAAEPAAPPKPPAAGLTEVRSPAVGIFYRRPSPDKDPFVDVGARIAAGDPVGTIEVMKMYTTVTSPVAGVVEEICVADGAFVEHDQVVVYVNESA